MVNAVGPIITDAWINHPNVTGLVSLPEFSHFCGINLDWQVWSGLPGQEAGNTLFAVISGSLLMCLAGNALVDVLYGDYNPR